MDTDIQQFCDDARATAETSSRGKTVTPKIDEQAGLTICTLEITFASLEELRQIYE